MQQAMFSFERPLVSAQAAFQAILAGDMPTIEQATTSYEVKPLLRDAGYFRQGIRGEWVCAQPFSYLVVNRGVYVQTDLVEWSVGHVSPKMTVVSYDR